MDNNVFCELENEQLYIIEGGNLAEDAGTVIGCITTGIGIGGDLGGAPGAVVGGVAGAVIGGIWVATN